MEALASMFTQMLQIAEQSPDKDSPTDSVLDFSQNQRLRTIKSIGPGVDATSVRFELNRALAAGAYTRENTKCKVNIEQGTKGGIQFNAPAARTLPMGRIAKFNPTYNLVKAVKPMAGNLKMLDYLRGVHQAGFRLQMSVYKNTRSFYELSALESLESDWKYWATSSTSHTLFVGDENNRTPKDTLVVRGSSHNRAWLKLTTHTDDTAFLSWREKAEKNSALRHYHPGYTISDNGALISSKCTAGESSLSGMMALSNYPSYLDSEDLMKEKIRVDMEKEDQEGTLRDIKDTAASRLKLLKKEKLSWKKVLDWKCESSEPHYHEVSSERTVDVEVYATLVFWHEKPAHEIDEGDLPEGMQPAALVPSGNYSRSLAQDVYYDYQPCSYGGTVSCPEGHEALDQHQYFRMVKNEKYDPRNPKSGPEYLEELEVSDDELEFPYAYCRQVHIATYRVAVPYYDSFKDPRQIDIPYGVSDLSDYVDVAYQKVTKSLSDAQSELRRVQTESSQNDMGLKTVSLVKISTEERLNKRILALDKVRKETSAVRDLLTKIFDNTAEGENPKLPVSTSGKPDKSVILYLPSDGSLNKSVAELLKKVSQTKDLASVTVLAPEGCLGEDCLPRPLPDDVAKRLMLLNKSEKSGRPPASAQEVAWRDLIIGFNASKIHHKHPAVPINKALLPRIDVGKGPARKAAEKEYTAKLSSETDKLRLLIENQEKQIAALASSLTAAMTDMAGVVKEVKDNQKKSEGQGLSSQDIADLMKAVIERADATAAEALVPEDDNLSMSTGRPQSINFDVQSSSSEESEDEGPKSHATINGMRWQAFNPLLIKEGGSYLVVRSVHDKNLYMCPKKAEIPMGGEVSKDGLLTFNKSGKGGNQPASKAPVAKTEPKTKPSKGKVSVPKKAASTSSSDSDKESEIEAVATPAVSEDLKKKIPDEQARKDYLTGKLTVYKCFNCKAVHGNKHELSCTEATKPWGRLTTAAKKQRDEALSASTLQKKSGGGGKAKEPEAKAQSSKKKDPVEQQDPLKVLAPLSDKDEKKLRSHFGVQPRPTPEDLEGKSVEERKALFNAAKLPKWAVRAVQEERGNLKTILDGSLTVEHFKAGKYLRKKRSFSQKEISEKWLALKSKFEGVSLLEKPNSNKEKALKKAFDLLKKEVGDHPSLPKPRQGSSRETSPSRTRGAQGSSQSNTFQPFMEGMKAMCELVKALK